MLFTIPNYHSCRDRGLLRFFALTPPDVSSPSHQGVVKRIIPAVASTNAVIAAACATEVFKLATSCAAPMNNYMVFNDEDGIYTYTYEHERNVSGRTPS